MSLEASLFLVVTSVLVSFGLIFVMAAVEERMFDAVAVSPEDEGDIDSGVDAVTELTRAA